RRARAGRSPAPRARPHPRAARPRARSSLRHNRGAAWGRDRGGATWNGSGGPSMLARRCCAMWKGHKASASAAVETSRCARPRAVAYRSVGRKRPADGTSPRRPPLPPSGDNASQNPAPFVAQRPTGPGVSKVNPSDPAAPMYRLLAKMRSPVTLRDLMIHPVRTGYIGQEQPITAADLPKSAAELYPKIGVSEVAV